MAADDLLAERRHLKHARQCLVAMRESIRALDAHGGDAVSTEFLKAELFRRAQAMLDDPSTPLFFGRIDRQRERFYVGRRHVRDERGDPVVVDWRADISRGFYRASATEPMGISFRRRFGFSAGELTGFEDERIDAGETRSTQDSAIVRSEIERPRVGPMRDIVATIQPDQDVLVRADLSDTVAIQGAPGTGKTAVGLHRAAYLLYAHREQLKRSRVLVVGPNRAFLSYIGNLLPTLGELDVVQVAIDDVISKHPAKTVDPPEVAAIKGDERMAEVISRAIRIGITEPTADLVLVVGPRRYRLPRYQLVALIRGEVDKDIGYDVARGRLGTLLAETVRRRIEAAGGAPEDTVVNKLAKSDAVKRWIDEHWPAITAPGIITRLLAEPEFLAVAAADLLDDDERRLLLWESPPQTRAVKWSAADRFLIDEASGALQRPETFGHVVIDEAQDLSAMQCRAIARRCPSGSATVLGDIAQATATAAVADWSRTLRLIGQPAGRVVTLSRGYRVPGEILDVANRLLSALEVDLPPATSLRQNAGSLRMLEKAPLAPVIRELMDGEGSIGVIAAPDDLKRAAAALRTAGIEAEDVSHGVEARVTLVPVTLCKGLEFDHVVVIEPANIVLLPRGLNWLYVALTRAVTSLSILHDQELPPTIRP